MAIFKTLKKDIQGDAVVEATILFPIMIMIFAALVVLSAYLPTRAALQRATQYAATSIATQSSDVWLFYDLQAMSYYRERDIRRLGSVYSRGFGNIDDISARAEAIVKGVDRRFLSLREGEMTVECTIRNNILFREVAVTATRRFTSPINLSFIGFPETIDISVTATAVVNDGDEFIRNIDLIMDFSAYIENRYGFPNVGETIATLGSRFLGIIKGISE